MKKIPCRKGIPARDKMKTIKLLSLLVEKSCECKEDCCACCNNCKALLVAGLRNNGIFLRDDWIFDLFGRIFGLSLRNFRIFDNLFRIVLRDLRLVDDLVLSVNCDECYIAFCDLVKLELGTFNNLLVLCIIECPVAELVLGISCCFSGRISGCLELVAYITLEASERSLISIKECYIVLRIRDLCINCIELKYLLTVYIFFFEE